MASGIIHNDDFDRGFVEITSTSSDTYGSALDKVGALIDFSKVREQTKVIIADQIYNCNYYASNTLAATKSVVQANKVKIDSMIIKADGSIFRGIENSFTITDVSSATLGSGIKIKVVY